MWLWGCLSNLVLQGQYKKWFWVTGVARWGAVIWEEKLKVCHLSDIAETRCSLPTQLPHQQECRAGIKIKKIKIKIYGSEFTSKPYCSTGKGHVQIHQEMKQNKTKQKRVHPPLPLSDLWWSGAAGTTRSLLTSGWAVLTPTTRGLLLSICFFPPERYKTEGW